MRIPRTASFFVKIVIGLALFVVVQFSLAQSSNTATTRTNNPDGSTTVTTTTTYSDGSVTTETTYDKDGHDAGTTRTDVQTKDGVTTTTITKYDGNGHEIGKTVTRVDKDGNTTVTNYDANGQVTGSSTLPPFKWKPDWKIGIDYKVPPEWRYLPLPKTETQNSGSPAPPKAGTTRVSDANGTTITTVSIFSDGWIITVTRYDNNGHDAGTTRTDVQTKDGQTTTTTTNWDGNGHETGKTIERTNADGSKTKITYDGQGHETSRTTTAKRSANASLENYDFPSRYGERSDSVCHSDGSVTTVDVEQFGGQLKAGCEQLRQQRQQNKQPPQGPATPTKVGIVVPANGAGQCSGSVVTNPAQFQGIPGLKVTDFTVSLPKGADGKPTLDAIQLDTGNKVFQQASDPISVPQISVPWTVRIIGPSDQRVDVPMSNAAHVGRRDQSSALAVRAATDDAPVPRIFSTLPVFFGGGVTVVHGPFSGNAGQMMAMIGDKMATPIAACQDKVFIKLPADAPEGTSRLTVADGSRVITAPVTKLKLATSVDQPVLHKGQRTNGHVTLSVGPTSQSSGAAAPQPAWNDKNWNEGADYKITNTPGVPATLAGPSPNYDADLVSMEEFHKKVPDFQPPQPGQQGTIFLSLTNRTPERISIEGFKGLSKNYSLPPGSLPFNDTLRIHAIADGDFDIGVIAQPFLPPIRCQEFNLMGGPQIVPAEKTNMGGPQIVPQEKNPQPVPLPQPIALSPPPPEPPFKGCKLMYQAARPSFCRNGVVVNVMAFLWWCPADPFLGPEGQEVTTVETTTIAPCPPGIPGPPKK